MLLDLHHEVMQVDELGAGRQAAERRLTEDLVEAMVVLDELGEGALRRQMTSRGRHAGPKQWRPLDPHPGPHLDDAGSVLEVGEGPHDVLAHGLH